MEKQNFDEAGFLSLQDTLYSLPDEALQMEADQLSLDFRSWINAHFELTTIQGAFFSQLNQKVVDFLRQQTAFAVANRLPISLVKLDRINGKGEPEDGKLFVPKSKLSATANSSGGFEPGGELIIEVSYQN